MRLPAAKRIVIEDLPEEIQDSMQTIATILNPFIEDVTTILNGSVSGDNLERKIVKFDVKTNANKIIIGILDISTGLARPPMGANVVNIQMTDNAQQIPNIDNPPFILFQPISATSVRVNKILNLKENSKYTITVEFL